MQAISIVLALGITGCSLFRIPKPAPYEAPEPCVHGTGPVRIDVTLGILTLAGGLAAITFSEPRRMNGVDGDRNVLGTSAGIALGLGALALFTSAKIGYTRAERCLDRQHTDPRFGSVDD